MSLPYVAVPQKHSDLTKASQGASEIIHKLVQVCLPFHTGHAKEQNSEQAVFQSSFAADETNLSGPTEIYHMGNCLSHI